MITWSRMTVSIALTPLNSTGITLAEGSSRVQSLVTLHLSMPGPRKN